MDDDADAVWTEIAGAGLLADLFGGWPSFRDAEIRSISIERASGDVAMVIDYSDAVEGDIEANIRARICFSWSQVEELKVSLTDTWVGGMEFKRAGDQTETLIDQRNGTYGRILAASLEATVKRLDTPSDDTDEFPAIRLEYR